MEFILLREHPIPLCHLSMSCSIFTDLSVRLTNCELTLTGYFKRYKSQDLALDLISFFL